jgi:hypothetical protein
LRNVQGNLKQALNSGGSTIQETGVGGMVKLALKDTVAESLAPKGEAELL